VTPGQGCSVGLSPGKRRGPHARTRAARHSFGYHSLEGGCRKGGVAAPQTQGTRGVHSTQDGAGAQVGGVAQVDARDALGWR